MNDNTRNIMFSSAKQDWTTPDSLFNELNKEFNFNTDAASSDENCKCEHHFTEEDSGLDKEWMGSVWLNPPYNDCKTWLRKAFEESQHGSTVVCLVPARTDTQAFHDYCMNAEEIRLIRGRLKFGNSKNTAPFPSMIVVFGDNSTSPKISTYRPGVYESRAVNPIYNINRNPLIPIK